MNHRKSPDLPRVSGRAEDAGPSDPREPQRVFRRFFDLLERFEKPGGNAHAARDMKSQPRGQKKR